MGSPSKYSLNNLNPNSISNNTSQKLTGLVQDIQDAVENLNGIKIHGTPVSLRAYCLVFIYILPFIFIPTLVYNLSTHPVWLIYALGILHGFILISLYNLQEHIEDPFDQMDLDDIKLVEFQFRESEAPTTTIPEAANAPTQD